MSLLNSPTASSNTYHFSVFDQPFVRRGLNEMRPKRLNAGKLLTSIVHQAVCRIPDKISEILIFSDFPEEESETARKFLKDVAPLKLLPFNRDLIVENFGTPEDGIKILAVVGRSEVFINPRFTTLANSIETIYPEAVSVLNQEIANHLDRPTNLEEILYEETVGRTQLLDIEKHSVKFLRRLQKSNSKSSAPHLPKEAIVKKVQGGWGLGVMMMSSKTSIASFKIISKDISLVEADMNLEFAGNLLNHANRWLLSEGQPQLEQLKSIALVTPYGVLAGQLMHELNKRHTQEFQRHYLINDYLFGWQPTLSIMELLRGEILPVGVIHIEKFPEITFSLITSVPV